MDRGFFSSDLRKPDFQRETTHWSPSKVVDLLRAFIKGDLIPAVILWQRGQEIFVIDGAHRLSALIAWLRDDYGDRATSIQFFGSQIPPEQQSLAERTRRLVNNEIDDVGIARLYRTVSIGSDPSLPDAIGFTNEATSLKPYAPVHIQGSRDGARDLTISWVRRTRYDGAWRDLVDVPLNEASEAYEVDGAGEVARTIASSTPVVTYTTADQTTDFGTPQATIDIAVYQLSAAVGRGFAGRSTL